MSGMAWKLAGAALLAGLAACGDGSAGGASGGPTTSPTAPATPAPSITPSPSPTPPFAPVAMQLFEEGLYNTDLRTLGHGTLAGPMGPNASLPYSKIAEANELAVTYDGATKLYRAAAGIAGTGILVQVDAEGFQQIPAVVATDPAAAKGVSPELFVRPAGPGRTFRYVAQVWPWTNTNPGGPDNLFYFGSFGVAQPTRAVDLPGTGTGRYDGDLMGFFIDDAGAYGLGGKLTMDLNFASLTGTGSFLAKFGCMMGCGYPDVAYSLGALKKTTGITFEGDILLTSGEKKGRFSGILAGPGAQEMLLELTFSYPHPVEGRDANFAGIVIARKVAAP